MVALKRRHFGVLLATFALVLSFFGLAQFVGAQAPASAAPLSCPAPTTDVSDKVTLDWNNAQLVDHSGRETHAVGDWWDLGIKLPWQTEGRVKAGDYFTYDASIVNSATGQSVLRPNITRQFEVISNSGVVVGCGTWGTDGKVTVVFNEKVESAAQWYGHVSTNGLTNYTGPGDETYTVKLGKKVERELTMLRRTPGVARYQKDGWLTLPENSDGDENQAIMWRVVFPAGNAAVSGASIVDEVPAGSNWNFNCDVVNEYTKNHTYLVTDPTTSAGLSQGNDTSHGAFGAAAQVDCTSTKVTVTLAEIPANQSAIILLPGHVQGAKRAGDINGLFSNTVNFNVAGVKITEPITKVLRYGASADAYAHQTFSVTKKVEGDLPESAKDLEYTLSITLKNDADPSVNKTFEATLKAGETYTYPTSLPLGTVVTVSEGDLPAGADNTWVDGESRVFETADGVTLSADNREATFTLSDDQVYSLTLTNVLAPTPTPSATPSTPAPTPSATPSPAPQLAKTGTDAAGLGVLAGIVAIAGLSLVAAKRRSH
jgi:putative LPXTG-motif protein cell wall anchor domain protein